MKIDSSSVSTLNAVDSQPIARKVKADDSGTRDTARVMTRRDAEVFPPEARDLARSNAEVFPPEARDITVRPEAQVTPIRDALISALS